ncbi:DUF7674 family protein [Bremerella cremea]|uniref:DUF7674 family protein n=1 Tax=Bremerella cremea TaxID=1031537 RepID=UPI0031E83E0E
MSPSKRLNRDAFIQAIEAQFPEVAETFDEIDQGLLHLEVAAFRRCVERAMDEGRGWDVERYCRFVVDALVNADDSLDNAIGVSFLEDFALGDFTSQRHEAVHQRMPGSMRDEIVRIDDRWH